MTSVNANHTALAPKQSPPNVSEEGPSSMLRDPLACDVKFAICRSVKLSAKVFDQAVAGNSSKGFVVVAAVALLDPVLLSTAVPGSKSML